LAEGFNPESDKHMSYMRIVNPENGATITGEAGDNIGRGGRKTIYFKDESAHYERPDKIEASLSENTRVQMDISSASTERWQSVSS
jgi:phage terminase large subunit